MAASFDLLSALTERGKLSRQDAERVRKEAAHRGVEPDRVVYEQSLVSESDMATVKADALGLEKKQFGQDETIPRDVLQAIPQESSKFYRMLALASDSTTLSVGMVYPEQTKGQEAAAFIAKGLNKQLRMYVITPSDFDRLFKGYSSFGEDIASALATIKKQTKGQSVTIGSMVMNLDDASSLKSEETPIIRMVSDMVAHGINEHASDIHIEPERTRLRIRYRVDGDLYSALYLPLEVQPAIVSRIKIMANLKIDETRAPQDGRFSAIVSGRQIDFRVSTFPTANGEKVAIRILDPSTGLRTLEQLGFSQWNFAKAQDALKKPFGMILATGPTGSGKSTTLYAMLQVLNQDGLNVVTLEDPIEYFMDGVNQSQVIPEIGYTFGSGLRSILRQDPNVIMVGEIRDQETAELGVHAALTGHIMPSSLHTNNAVGAIPRLIDLGVQRFLLPATLTIVISQRLLRALCDQCKKPVQATGEMEKIISDALATLPDEIKKQVPFRKPYTVYEPVGCSACKGKGTIGRIGAYEILHMTPELESLILNGQGEANIFEEAHRQGMTTMRQEGIFHALNGKVSLAEVIRETA